MSVVDNLNMQAQISADATAFVKAIDAAIEANLRLAQSSGLAGNQIDAIDKKLNSARKTVVGSTNDVLAQERATARATKAWDAQNRIYEDYLRHQARATAGTREQNAELGALDGNLIRARYALYDVATSYAAVAAATLGAVTATTLLSARYETAFTEIERTTLTSAGTISAGVDALREQFLDLSEVIPLSFEELTKIGSLGAQLGIAEQDLVSFTETVAQFSKLSGVSAEQTALAFGRIGELLNVSASEYVNLGSAIAANAVSAAATEAQIISLTREISAGAAGAGLAVDEVIGLSSALASLGVAPERARGALSTYYGTLNRAVAEGGQALQDFATITGFTAEQLDNLVRSGEGGQVLQAFIQGLNQLDNVTTTQALDRLGLAQLRVSDTFVRLGQNVDFVNEQLQIAETAYANGTFLGDAYSVVLDDVASQFQLLLNSIGRFLATAGLPFLEFLRVALPLAADFFTALSEFAGTDLGQNVIGLVGALTVLVGVIAAVRSASALATASLFAFRTASLALGEAGVLGGMRGIVAQMLGIEAGAKRGTIAVAGLGAALAGIAKATIVLGVIAGAIELIGIATQTAEQRAEKFFGTVAGFSDAVQADTQAWRSGAEAIATFTTQVERAAVATADAGESARDWLSVQNEAGPSLETATDAVGAQTIALGENAEAWLRKTLAENEAIQRLANDPAALQAFRDLGGNIDEFIRESLSGNGEAYALELLEPLANQIAQLSSQNEGMLSTRDAQIVSELSQRYQLLYNALVEAGKASDSLVASQRALAATNAFVGLGGEASTLNPRVLDAMTRGLIGVGSAAGEASGGVQRFGGSAGGAGKQVRTLVDYANDLSKVFSRAFDIRFGSQSALDTLNDSWETLNERVRDARIELQQLTADKNVKEYFLSVAEAYGDELRAGVLRGEIAEINEKMADTQADASTELQGNSKAARQNRSVITGLVKNYQDYITALAESGADQATLNAAVARSRMEFMNQARALGFADAELQPYVATFDDLRIAIAGVPRNITVSANANPAIQALNEFLAQARSSVGGGISVPITAADANVSNLIAARQRAEAERAKFNAMGEREAANAMSRTIALISAQIIALRGYSSGGYTGAGGKYEPAGIVHRGEYVIPKEGVNQSTGLPKPGYMNALGGQMPSSRGGSYAGGGMVTSNTLIVELGPKSLRAMQAGGMNGDVVIAVDSVEIARANARGQKQLAYRGEA